MDGTVLFLDHDMIQATELKLVLSTFEQLSRLKLILTKVNFSVTVLTVYARMFDTGWEVSLSNI